MIRSARSIKRALWILAVFLLCAVFARWALRQDKTWDTYNQAGRQAHYAAQYAKAERMFKLALEEAESFERGNKAADGVEKPAHATRHKRDAAGLISAIDREGM